MIKTPFLLFFCLFCQSISAQYQIGIVPRTSPDKKVYQKVGFTEIEIQYGSPAVKDRQIWGELVPYSKVWRAGANAATTIEFSSAVKIGGQNLDSGKYSFFIIPHEKGDWTIIFNKIHKQWGAFKYDKEQDILRFNIKPKKVKSNTENLSYTLQQKNFKEGSIFLNWEFMELEISFQTQYLTEFAKIIEARAELQPSNIRWIPYLQGAAHLEEIKDSLELALIWINKAEEIMDLNTDWNESFYPRVYIEGHLYWTKAKILAWNKNFKDAMKYVERLKNMEERSFYTKKNNSEGIDLHFSQWKKK